MKLPLHPARAGYRRQVDRAGRSGSPRSARWHAMVQLKFWLQERKSVRVPIRAWVAANRISYVADGLGSALYFVGGRGGRAILAEKRRYSGISSAQRQDLDSPPYKGEAFPRGTGDGLPSGERSSGRLAYQSSRVPSGSRLSRPCILPGTGTERLALLVRPSRGRPEGFGSRKGQGVLHQRASSRP
jgi:hypothetical protein